MTLELSTTDSVEKGVAQCYAVLSAPTQNALLPGYGAKGMVWLRRSELRHVIP